MLKLEGTRRVGKPSLRWLESVEEDLKNMGIRNWSRKSHDRDQLRTVLEKLRSTKVYYVRRKRRRRRRKGQYPVIFLKTDPPRSIMSEEKEEEEEEEERGNIR